LFFTENEETQKRYRSEIMVTVKVNGKDIIFEKEVSVNELLEVQKVEMKDYVTVQINDELMDRSDFEDIFVRNGDVVEFLYFMGGGTL